MNQQADLKGRLYDVGQKFQDWQIHSTSSFNYVRFIHLDYNGEPIEGTLNVFYNVMGGGNLEATFTPGNLTSSLPDVDLSNDTVVWSLNSVPVRFGSTTSESALSDLCGEECLLSVEDGLNNTTKEYEVLIYPDRLNRAYFALGRSFETLNVERIELTQ